MAKISFQGKVKRCKAHWKPLAGPAWRFVGDFFGGGSVIGFVGGRGPHIVSIVRRRNVDIPISRGGEKYGPYRYSFNTWTL